MIIYLPVLATNPYVPLMYQIKQSLRGSMSAATPPACALQGEERYNPVRGLLRLAPPRGPQRYDFAASLLRGMTADLSAAGDPESEARAKRFDMVWDLVRGMRAAAEAGAAARDKYDPVWQLLEEARVEQVGWEVFKGLRATRLVGGLSVAVGDCIDGRWCAVCVMNLV